MFDHLSSRFLDVLQNVRGKGKITEGNIEEALGKAKTALLEADVSFAVVEEFIASVKEKSLGEGVLRGVDPGDQFVKILHDELAAVMGEGMRELDFARTGPLVVLVVGLNGQGKTSFAGKLSHFLKRTKKSTPLLVAADTFRPAAAEQLKILAGQAGADFFGSEPGQHPRDVALAGMARAREGGNDVVIVDTAGRLHIDEQLMEQIGEVKRAMDPFRPEVLLVCDAMAGQEARAAAGRFHETVGLTGVVLTKMDSDAKGGAALSIGRTTGVGVMFISTGEKIGDLDSFKPDRLAGRILDMGDVVTLVEKASEAVDEAEAQKMVKRMERGRLSVNDFLKQMDVLAKMGSLSSMVKMLPGAGSMLKKMGDLGSAQDEMKGMRIIANSMTKKEREDYRIVDKSRMRRIAGGSGTSGPKVEEFLAKFRQMERMMGPLMQMMKGGGPIGPGFRGVAGGGGSRRGRAKKRQGGNPWGGGRFFNR